MPSSSVDIRALFRQQVGPIDAALAEALEQLSPDCPDRLRDAMRYSLLAPGKRLRPVLVLLACDTCGSDPVIAMPAACAIEMIHTYSLIHDDLPAMDDDDLRRGRPTCHKQFDEATAILAGDGLLTLAFEVLARGIRPSETALDCIRELAAAAGAEGMVGGQMADLEAETGGVSTGAALEAIHRRKTGRLLTAAVVMGGLAGGASPQSLSSLRRYGESVGLAFQIADDLLDVESTAEKMGKGVGKDAQHGKLTYPALWGREESRRRAEALVEAACTALAPFGDRGASLNALARYVISRDH